MRPGATTWFGSVRRGRRSSRSRRRFPRCYGTWCCGLRPSSLKKLSPEHTFVTHSGVSQRADAAHIGYLSMARALLILTLAMLRWLLAFVFILAPLGAVWAQPAATSRAQDAAVAAERRVGQLATQRDALQRRFDEQNATNERLKKQRASWRRDRDLNEARADANETATQLANVSR